VRWSVIGNLQTNKAKYVARFADEFQSLDRLRVAEALERRLEKEDRTMDVFVQVNTSNEDSKYGVPPAELAELLQQLRQFERLNVRGLMTLAVFLMTPRGCALVSSFCTLCVNRCETNQGMMSCLNYPWACQATSNLRSPKVPQWYASGKRFS